LKKIVLLAFERSANLETRGPGIGLTSGGSPARSSKAGRATAARQRRYPFQLMESTDTLADGVIELTRTLAKLIRHTKERGYEKEQLNSVQAGFRKHLAWQQQRMHSLQRDVERLHNETSWLTEKTSEVNQDASLLAHEIRQCRREMEQVRTVAKYVGLDAPFS
jgi:predicted RNase H-like nuclease (RuvC/YqgF family)